MIAIIEIPQGSLYKYEMDKVDKTLKLDRMLNQPVPFNYGFIPDTLSGDGDPIDVFVLGELPIHPLAKVEIVPIAVLLCQDNEKEDNKLIAVIASDTNNRYTDEHQINTTGTDVIIKYLTSYKTGFVVNGIGNAAAALTAFEEAKRNWIINTDKVNNHFWNK